ncbi:MAG: hypothetical protein OET79_06325, partial [Nitrospirota bacterium]|nr:hypothetical protein [Nitrospirota bacterium]
MQFGFRPRSCRADCHQALLVANHIHRPLPIGHGQTISQPFIVALMTDMLQVESDNVVLEIGTGSGCQAARLAHLVREVDTIEIIPAYAETAAATLRELAYNNVKILCRRWLFRGSGSRAVRRHHGHGCGQPSVAAAY